VTFATGQTFPGAGTITGVTAGSGLTGGGTSGTVNLSLLNSCSSGQVLAWNGTAWACSTIAGSGTITGVTAGTDLTGGGTSGTVTVNLDTTKVPQLGTANTFTEVQTINNGTTAQPALSANNDNLGGTGVYGNGYTSGFYGNATASNGNGVYGQGTGLYSYGVYGNGVSSGYGVYSNGNFAASGTKSAVVALPDDRVVSLYAVESPENWFEDFGSGQLKGGRVVIQLDATFAQTVTPEVGYHVFLTPNDECEGLYVTNRTATGFEVRELHGGKSSVTFDYRIVAKRKGLESLRLEDVHADHETTELIRQFIATRPSHTPQLHRPPKSPHEVAVSKSQN
jgi:hypothetical protein